MSARSGQVHSAKRDHLPILWLRAGNVLNQGQFLQSSGSHVKSLGQKSFGLTLAAPSEFKISPWVSVVWWWKDTKAFWRRLGSDTVWVGRGSGGSGYSILCLKGERAFLWFYVFAEKCGFSSWFHSVLPPPQKNNYAKNFLKNYFRGDCDNFAKSITQKNSLRIIFSGVT